MINDSDGNLVTDTAERDGVAVVTVTGEIDSSNCATVQDLLADLARPGREAVEVDLAGVSFVDSSGLRALIVGQRSLAEVGAAMTVVAASEAVRRLFEITGLVERLGLPG